MRDDTKTGLLIFLGLTVAAWLPIGVMLLVDKIGDMRTPEGMVYTAGNGPSGKAYEKNHERRQK